MKSRCLLNFYNSTSQFISIMFRCSFFFYQINNFLFLLWVSLYMITGIHFFLHFFLHFFSRAHFSWPLPFLSLKKLWPSLCFHPLSPPPANFWQVPYMYNWKLNCYSYQFDTAGGRIRDENRNLKNNANRGIRSSYLRTWHDRNLNAQNLFSIRSCNWRGTP